MPKGAFKVYQEPNDPRDIRFEVCLDPEERIPAEQSNLRDEIDITLLVLRMIFPQSDERFKNYFKQLLGLAQAGLVGDRAQPAAAHQALIVLRDQITAQEGGRIKNKYMKELGWKALLIGPGLLLVYVVISLFHQLDGVFKSYLFLWAGCMAGVWLSFGARKRQLRFEDLHILEQDRMEPLVRLIFAGLLAVIFGLLFSSKMVVIKFGSVESWQFTEQMELALLFGILIGFSEQILPSTVGSKASELLNQM